MENKNVETTKSTIDKDVLDIMAQEDVLKAVSDDKQVKRLILNCFCEFLSEIKDLRKEFDEFMQMISVCSANKLADFFKELQKNVKNEVTAQNVQAKIEKGHKKPQNKSKK